MGEVVSHIEVSKEDMIVIQSACSKAMEVGEKFKYSDISESNLSQLAGETTLAFRRVVGDREFLSLNNLLYYRFKYISVHVDNVTNEVSLVPMFEVRRVFNVNSER